MKKLLLLDADVIIDLHTLALFEKICRTYRVHATKTVIREAAYFKRGGKTERIEIGGNKVSIIDDVDLASLRAVQTEAATARLGVDPGEVESIAYLSGSGGDMIFCTCDKAAIKLVSFMELESRSASVESVLRHAGHRIKNLYPRHYDKSFEECVREGKVLRIQLKLSGASSGELRSPRKGS